TPTRPPSPTLFPYTTLFRSWRTLLPGVGRREAGRITELTWEILERTHLADQAGELAGNLPYGKRKYLEIARALALRPKLLLLDRSEEHTSELQSREKLVFRL